MTGPVQPEADSQPPEPEPAPPRFGIVRVLAGLTAALGVAMIIGALSGGGGIGSYGVLVGSFFLAAGLLRLRLLIARAGR